MSPVEPIGPSIGTVLHGSYKLTRLIAEGGMGSVYEASHSRLTKKRFAVKMLHQRVAKIAELYARFRREAEIVTDLGHPNIVDVIDFNETDEGQPYMVMEFLVGEDLDARIERRGRLPNHEVAQIVRQTASALQAVHDRGIVHRDMKPENIFLVCKQPDGPFTVKLLDFGISKIKHSDSIVTKAHTLMGTLQFMSPEQATGQVSEIDHRTDIFALGAICYYMLSKELPFDAETPYAIITRLVNETPTPLTKLDPELPEAVWRVIERALSKQRERRQQRVEDFAAELEVGLTATRPALARGGTLRTNGPARQLAKVTAPPAGARRLESGQAKFETGPLERVKTLEHPKRAKERGLDLGGLAGITLETLEGIEEQRDPGGGVDELETTAPVERLERAVLAETEKVPRLELMELEDPGSAEFEGFSDDDDTAVDGDIVDGDETVVDGEPVSFETPAAMVLDLPRARDPEDEAAPPLGAGDTPASAELELGPGPEPEPEPQPALPATGKPGKTTTFSSAVGEKVAGKKRGSSWALLGLVVGIVLMAISVGVVLTVLLMRRSQQEVVAPTHLQPRSAAKQPALKQPTVKQPAVKQPAMKQPAVKQPAVKQRADAGRGDARADRGAPAAPATASP